MSILKNKRLASILPLRTGWDVAAFAVSLLVFNGLLFIFLKLVSATDYEIRNVLLSGSAGMLFTLLAVLPIRCTVDREHLALLRDRISGLSMTESYHDDVLTVYIPKAHRSCRWDASQIIIQRKTDACVEVTLPLSKLRLLSATPVSTS